MLDYTIQWLRAYYCEKSKGTRIPTKKDESYMLKSMSFNRRIVPNVFKLPFFCFPCGVYLDDIKVHDSTRKHINNDKKWHKKMGYIYWGPK
jgi:hypothetical protein